MSALAALLKRDLILAVREGAGVGTALGFFLTVLVFLPIAIGPDQALLTRIAPGMLWVILLLAVLLSADRLFEADYEDGSLDAMALGPVPFELVVLTKAAAHWLTTGLPLAIAAPLLGFLMQLDVHAMLPLGLAMIFGSFALSLLASLGAAVTVGLRRGGLVVSLLILPLYIPVLIFGVSASMPDGAIAVPALLILLAMALASLVLVPVGAAAALRVYLK
ncbi:heme exporter protein CcmB [soil metagenome]